MRPDQLDALSLAVCALAAYRLTRLIVLDTLFGHPAGKDTPATGLRARLDDWAYYSDGTDRSRVRGKVADGLTCVFCVGVWASAAVVPAWVLGPEWLQWAVIVAAVAGAQAFVSSRFGS